MRIHRQIDLPGFKVLAARIRSEPSEWKCIDVSPPADASPLEILSTAQKVDRCLAHGHEGDLFVFGQGEILTLCRMGSGTDLSRVQDDIGQALGGGDCKIVTGNICEMVLHSIESRLKCASMRACETNAEDAFQKERAARAGNKLFVVDDSSAVRKILKDMLKGVGEVLEFPDPSNVVESYLREAPDAVITDIHMPGNLSGLDLLRKIRAYDSHAYVVLQSSDTSKDRVVEARECGANAFLAKPFTAEKIYDILTRCKTLKVS